EAGRLELLHAGLDQARRNGQVEHPVPGDAKLALDLLQPPPELDIRLPIRERPRHVEQRVRVLGPVRLVEGAAREALDAVAGNRAKARVVELVAGEADDSKVGRQHAVERQIVDGGKELAGAQVAGAAEDHQRTGLRDQGLGQSSREKVRRTGVRPDGVHGQALRTAWPPKALRSAASIFSENDSSWRERKRV